MTKASLWQLPSAGEFLAEVEAMIWRGGGVICVDAAMPPRPACEIERMMRDALTVTHVEAVAGEQPLAALGAAFGGRAELGPLVAMSYSLAIVDLTGLSTADARPWSVFLPRFQEARQALPDGMALIVLGPSDFARPDLPRLQMSGRIRRGDAMIWAEFGVGTRRSDLLEHLAVAVAVELCGWRLDLIEDLVSQRIEDILDPRGWLRRNSDRRSDLVASFTGKPFACPIALMADGKVAEVEHRIWKAQVSAVFPWIEQQRLQCIDRFRKSLRLDEQAAKLGVTQVEDLEFGALKYQLRSIASRSQSELITAFTAMRNALAHRKPVALADLNFALAAGPAFG